MNWINDTVISSDSAGHEVVDITHRDCVDFTEILACVTVAFAFTDQEEQSLIVVEHDSVWTRARAVSACGDSLRYIIYLDHPVQTVVRDVGVLSVQLS